MDTITVYRMNGSLESAHAFEMTPEELYSTNFENEPELWRQVFKYPNARDIWPYLMSTHGRLMSLGGRQGATRGMVLAQWPGRQDYPYVTFCRRGDRWDARVNVALTWGFHGPPPGMGYQADHIDRIVTNNYAWNLRWLPRGINLERRVSNGNGKKYEVAPGVFKSMSELTDEEFARVISF